MASETFDFVIVGSGPAGSALAERLATSRSRPSVLLVEAGGDISGKENRCPGLRSTTLAKPGFNWGYKTQPQKHLNDRSVDASRGKGLGGSSAINFNTWAVGSSQDYNRWASLVGDENFRWEHMQRRFRSIENFHTELPSEGRKYSAPLPENHGSEGKINVSYVGHSERLERDLPAMVEAVRAAGLGDLNPDYNSGNPIGVSLYVNSIYAGVISTAADLLVDKPDNLKVLLESPVQRVILDGDRAIGVESNRRQYLASKDVILSAGAFNTPHILMHSGLGPSEQLDKFGIKVVRNIPAVGRNLRDHLAIATGFERTKGISDRPAFFGDQARVDAAVEQWEKDLSGEMGWIGCQGAIGWLKSDRILNLPELKDLPLDEQLYMKDKAVPQYELYTHWPVHLTIPELAGIEYSILSIILLNDQSRGQVTLQSADPNVPPAIDTNLNSHPFDRKAGVEMVRHLMEFVESPAFSKDVVRMLWGPKSSSDEDLGAFIKENGVSLWHPTGTAKMGKEGEADAVIDSHFKVFGIKGLRIADISVVPLLMNNHPQTTAYMTGVTCAEVLIKQYGLE